MTEIIIPGLSKLVLHNRSDPYELIFQCNPRKGAETAGSTRHRSNVKRICALSRPRARADTHTDRHTHAHVLWHIAVQLYFLGICAKAFENNKLPLRLERSSPPGRSRFYRVRHLDYNELIWDFHRGNGIESADKSGLWGIPYTSPGSRSRSMGRE